MQATNLAIAARPIWRLAELYGVDPYKLFEECGLDHNKLQTEGARFTVAQICSGYLKLEELTGVSNIALEALKVYDPMDFNAVGVAFFTSKTLMEAFERLDRYEKVINSHFDYTLIDNGETTDFICEIPSLEDSERRIIETNRAAVLLDMSRRALRRPFEPIEIHFTFQQPPQTGDLLGVLRCPLKFSKPIWRLKLKTSDLLEPLATTNEQLARASDLILDGMLRDLSKTDIASKVKRLIIKALSSGTPTEQGIADAVHMSPRTLGRRLAEENTNFSTLLTEVRREMAEQYISDPTIPIAEVSYLLGFADTSSFSRAFKRWTGEAPATFRANAA